jgi:NitT/TauT family transport system substrate-binding protein
MRFRFLFIVFAIVLLIAAWEFCCAGNRELNFVIPAPSKIFLRIGQKPDRFLFHSWITLTEMGGGIALAFLLAFPLALMMSVWTTMRLILQPLFVLMQCVPMFVLAPIMIFWFGWSYVAIVIPTALMIFFPLTLNIYKGFNSTPESYILYFRINQATFWQTVGKLKIPWASTYIFAGLRIAVAIAGIGAVAGEWAGAQNGLGILMLESRRSTDVETTFGAIFCLSALSLSLYGFFLLLEKGLIRRYLHSVPAMIIVCSLIFNGCQSSEKKGSPPTKLLLDWLPNPNHVPLFAGIEEGIFQKYGVEISFLKLTDPSETIPLLTSGTADLALYYTPDTIRAIKNDAHVVPVAILIGHPLNGFIYRKDLGIEAPVDLHNRKLGYSIGSFSQDLMLQTLKKRQVVPSQTQNVHFDLVASLGLKHVDFIYGAYWNIEIPHLKSLGIQTGYFNLHDFGFPSYPEIIVVASNKNLQKNPLFYEKFRDALQESIDFSRQNPEVAFALYAKANPDKSPETLSWEKEAWFLTIPVLAESQQIDDNVWNSVAESMESMIQ